MTGWSQGPAKALGRFDVRTPPKTLDEMYACAANETERTAIHDVIFGTAVDAIDRYLPDKHQHAVLRSMLAFLAINSTYRGPYTPGSATCLAFTLAVPDDTTAMMTKLEGGIGALCEHLHQTFVSNGGEIRYRAKVERILVKGDRVTGVRLRDGSEIGAPVVFSNLSPDHTLIDLVGAEHLPADLVGRLSGRDHRASFVQIHFALDGLPEFAPPYELLNEPGMQGSIGIFNSPEEQQRQWEECRRGIVPDNPSMGMQIPSVHDPSMAPAGKHAASAFAFAFPVETNRDMHGQLKNVMAEKVQQTVAEVAGRGAEHRLHVVRRERDVAYLDVAEVRCEPGDLACRGTLPARDDWVPSDAHSDRRAISWRRGMPWGPRDHVHPRLQRGPPSPRGRGRQLSDFANPLTSRMLAANTSGMTPGNRRSPPWHVPTTIRPTAGTPARTSLR